MMDGIFGPFEPEQMRELLDQMSKTRAAAVDRMEMSAESGNARIRTFVESLSEQQLDDFGWLLYLCTEQDDLVASLRGIATAEHWRRNPIKPEDAGGQG